MPDYITSGDKRLAQYIKEHETQDADAAYRAERDSQIREMDRYDKLDWLLGTSSEAFKQNLLHNIVASMSDDEFDGTFHYLCRVNMIARCPAEMERWERHGAGA